MCRPVFQPERSQIEKNSKTFFRNDFHNSKYDYPNKFIYLASKFVLKASSFTLLMTNSSIKINHKKLNTIRVDIRKQNVEDGSVILHSAVPLEPHPFRLTDRLQHWAVVAPNRVFIGGKNSAGKWEALTYSETFAKVKSIAQALLGSNCSTEKPLAILSENSIEHALIALAALHVGIPYSPINPAYALRSTDFAKLKRIISLLTPGLLFVSDAKKYEHALTIFDKDLEIVSLIHPVDHPNFTFFDKWLELTPTPQVEEAFQAITPHTVAKILFTSGSTGLPKGVINTHENISTNWQQLTQTLAFVKEEVPEFIDWLPWSHTFGGNHNFGLALYNGGSFYIDDGDPTPQGIATTVSNLKGRKPTIYFNVPKGFEALIPFFKADKQLRETFFSNLKMLFYAAASMSQHTRDEWEELSIESIGKKIVISTALGCTEASPATLIASEPFGLAGQIGVPIPGLELKLVPLDGKWEARYRGKNIFPGYWRQPELTATCFDEEGFYCSGDALKFVDEEDVNKGMIFDGRIAEDFKLSTGTWVNVGILRTQLIAAGKGLIQDVLITGHDKDYVGAIVFPALDYCRNLIGLDSNARQADLIRHPLLKKKLNEILSELAGHGTGSATLVKCAVFADFVLSVEKGEITEKGSINQRMTLQNHQVFVDKLYEIEIPD